MNSAIYKKLSGAKVPRLTPKLTPTRLFAAGTMDRPSWVMRRLAEANLVYVSTQCGPERAEACRQTMCRERN